MRLRRPQWVRLVAIAALVGACDAGDAVPRSLATSASATASDTPAGVEPEAGWFTVWPELESSIVEQSGWTGTLTGALWRRAPGPWLLCRVVEESFPPGCDYGLPIVGEPSVVRRGVARIETSSGVEWTEVTIEIAGDFDPATIEFVESP